MNVVIKSEPELWTVGHYDPAGVWNPIEDFDDKGEAYEFCSRLNGAATPPILYESEEISVDELLESAQYSFKDANGATIGAIKTKLGFIVTIYRLDCNQINSIFIPHKQ